VSSGPLREAPSKGSRAAEPDAHNTFPQYHCSRKTRPLLPPTLKTNSSKATPPRHKKGEWSTPSQPQERSSSTRGNWSWNPSPRGQSCTSGPRQVMPQPPIGHRPSYPSGTPPLVPTSHCSATRVLPPQDLGSPFTTPVRGLLARRPAAHGLWKLEAQGLLEEWRDPRPTHKARSLASLESPSYPNEGALKLSTLGGHPQGHS
jgi:hypothetical protein